MRVGSESNLNDFISASRYKSLTNDERITDSFDFAYNSEVKCKNTTASM